MIQESGEKEYSLSFFVAAPANIVRHAIRHEHHKENY